MCRAEDKAGEAGARGQAKVKERPKFTLGHIRFKHSCVYWAVGGGVKDRSIWNDCHVSLFLGFLTGHLRLDNSLGRSIPSTAGYVTFLDLCCISSH